MTVHNQQYKALYATNGVSNEFAFTYKVTDESWVKAYLQEVVGEPPVEVTNFTVTLNADQETTAGGTVTFDAPVPTGTLAILRQTPLTQELDYTAYDAFPAESHEKGMDKMTFNQQWTTGELARSIRYAYITDFEDTEWITLEKYTGSGQILYWKDENTLASATPSDPVLDLATLTYVDAQDEALQSQITAQGITIGSNTGRITVNEGDIADLQNDKADKSIQMVSGTTDMMSITDPSLDSDVTFDFRKNVANGTVQLDEFGFVPEGHLPPNGGLRLFGIWDAAGGDNPTDTRPDLVPYKSGDTYVIGVGGGTIDLLDPVTGLYVPTAVIEGDLIIFVINYDESVQGWAKGANVDTGSVAAALVTFVPVGGITSLNVQAGMEELDTKKLAKTGGTLSGSLTFTNGIGIQGTRADSMPVNVLYLDEVDQLVIGSPSVGLLYNYLGAGGAAWHNASGVAVMTLSQTGDLGLDGDLLLDNSKALFGNSIGGTPTALAFMDGGDNIRFGSQYSASTQFDSGGSYVWRDAAQQPIATLSQTGDLTLNGNVIATGDITAFSGTPLSNQALAARVDALEAQVADLLLRVTTLEA